MSGEFGMEHSSTFSSTSHSVHSPVFPEGHHRQGVAAGRSRDDVSHTAATLGGGGGSTVSATQNVSRKLLYPYDFFRKGKVPKTPEEALQYWSLRENRPAEGEADREVPDGGKMKREMQAIKNRLTKWVRDRYHDAVVQRAQDMKLTYCSGSCDQVPKNTTELKKAIAGLGPASEVNIQTFWNVLYDPVSKRSWLADCIEGFLDLEGKALKTPGELKAQDENSGHAKTRDYKDSRGGWTDIATSAKHSALRVLANGLFNKEGWKIVCSGPRGCKEKGDDFIHVEKDETKLRYQKKKIAVAANKTEQVWLVTMVSNLRIY
jgi:hypothetical protein